MAARNNTATKRARQPIRLPRLPNYYYEQQAWASGHPQGGGVDAAGRGAWAGPIVAAAVMLPVEPERRAALSRALTRFGISVNDSKKLLPEQRELVVQLLDAYCIEYAVAVISVEEIDARGVGYANAVALREAALGLRCRPQFVLSDAFRLPDYPGRQQALIKGDCRSRSIALASTVAKVTRDRLMVECDWQYPGYGFARHKGYGTAEHRAALLTLGPCPLHRRSFAPVQACIGAG